MPRREIERGVWAGGNGYLHTSDRAVCRFVLTEKTHRQYAKTNLQDTMSLRNLLGNHCAHSARNSPLQSNVASARLGSAWPAVFATGWAATNPGWILETQHAAAFTKNVPAAI